jgi:hypothetical protein
MAYLSKFEGNCCLRQRSQAPGYFFGSAVPVFLYKRRSGSALE